MKSLTYEEVKEQIQQLDTPEIEISIFLYRPKSEMNIGHIFRLADAVGIKKVWLYQPIQHLKWHKIEKLSRKNSRHIEYEILTEIKTIPSANNIALEWTDSSQNIYEYLKTPLPKSLTLFIGNEQKGLPEEILKHCTESIHLPMYGVHSSMNMAMATSVAVYTLLHG
jgi:tRNA G18 (ribose-2'-O)-methylase SpoU